MALMLNYIATAILITLITLIALCQILKSHCVFRAWDGQGVETRWKMYNITFLYITHTSKGTQPQRFTTENTVNPQYGAVLT
jgi:hypothetical protein